MGAPTKITFFERLIPSILNGNKTITIRDETECDYVSGTVVDLYALESDIRYGAIKILSVKPLRFEDISTYHAQQEAMTLPILKSLIREIYPAKSDFYVIEFVLVD